MHSSKKSMKRFDEGLCCGEGGASGGGRDFEVEEYVRKTLKLGARQVFIPLKPRKRCSEMLRVMVGQHF